MCGGAIANLWEGEREITFTFGGLGDGILELLDFVPDDEALESFSVEEAINVPWAHPRGFAIYCSAPLPKPMDVYRTVHDFLVFQGASWRAEQFLNCGNSQLFKTFVEISQSSSYLLGQVPPALCELVCKELDAQRVLH